MQARVLDVKLFVKSAVCICVRVRARIVLLAAYTVPHTPNHNPIPSLWSFKTKPNQTKPVCRFHTKQQTHTGAAKAF